MKKKLLSHAIFLFWFVLAQFCFLDDRAAAQDHQHAKQHHSSHHEAHHGGVLNVISKCDIGHVEVRVEEDRLEAWFVGGGKETHRSVPIQAEEVALSVIFPNGNEKILLLKADPMKLAGEKSGFCSHFSAQANCLKEVKQFEARGEIVFKGIRRPILIKYPEGYDPAHSAE